MDSTLMYIPFMALIEVPQMRHYHAKLLGFLNNLFKPLRKLNVCKTPTHLV